MPTGQQVPRAPSGLRERSDRDDPLRRLSAGIPVTERRLELAGVPTAVLEGGDGPAIVLLHGPGESSVNWSWVLPQLVETRRTIAPDLPAHGSRTAESTPTSSSPMHFWTP